MSKPEVSEGMERELQAGSHPALEARIADLGMTPGWVKRATPLLWKETSSRFVPAHWRYAPARDLMIDAGQRLGTDQAERRNFLMRNPSEGNDFASLRTMICAYQTMLPGERAMSHRHAPHAMRIMLDSDGAYSIVNGHRHPMNSGDIVLTPGGCWHGHGHEGSRQAFWIDGLDVPLTHLLEPMYYQPHPDRWEAVTQTGERSPMRFPWADTLAALKTAVADDAGHFGPTISLDTASMPTLTVRVSQWRAGFGSRPMRHTANGLFVVMRGQGESRVGDLRVPWSFGDVFAAPAWQHIEHRAHEVSIVCCISDEQLMRWTGYYRLECLQ